MFQELILTFVLPIIAVAAVLIIYFGSPKRSLESLAKAEAQPRNK